MTGFLAYEGPSLLGPHAIIVVVTAASKNSKTGNMRQAYILLRDTPPTMGIRFGWDQTICGACVHRGNQYDGKGRTCYVSMVVGGPDAVWKAYQNGNYGMVPQSARAQREILRGEYVRVGAYGDPAALPFRFWADLLSTPAGWTAYTHQWTVCDRRFRTLMMASVDNEQEMHDAQTQGWRTYRARPIGAPVLSGEFQCPAADEAGHRTTCRRCVLCRGLASPAKSVSIELHGQRFKGTRGEDWIARRDSLGLLRAGLEAGPVEWKGTAQDVSRIRFAITLWYRRQGKKFRLAINKVREDVYEMRLR